MGVVRYQPAFDHMRERYLSWLEAPGEDLGMFLGDAPSVDARLSKVQKAEPWLVLDLAKAKKPYGHKAYTKRTKTGKYVFVGKKGVKPEKPVDDTFKIIVKKNPWSATKDEEGNILVYTLFNALRKSKSTSWLDAEKLAHKVADDLYEGDIPALAAEMLDALVLEGAIARVSPDKKQTWSFNRTAFLNVLGGVGEQTETVVRMGHDRKGNIWFNSAALLGTGIRTTVKRLLPSAQKAIRDHTRALVAEYGAEPADLGKPHSDTLAIKKRMAFAGTWDQFGKMCIREDYLAPLVALAKGDRNLKKAGQKAKDSLRVLVHETLHGCSQAVLWPAYHTGEGHALEEVTTEVAARYITAKFFGDDFGEILTHPRLAYSPEILETMAKISSVMTFEQRETLDERIANASLAMKKSDALTEDEKHLAASGGYNGAANVMMRAFIRHLGITGAAAYELEKKLSTTRVKRRR